MIRTQIVLMFLLASISACSPGDGKIKSESAEAITKDFKTWWNYNYNHINLSKNYTPLDAASKVISKESFLKTLTSGDYIAFRIKGGDSTLKYQLYKLSDTADNEIRTQIKRFAEDGLREFKMEGTEVPGFDFTDIEGKVYNKENTKGKIVVLKCWFIHCVPCVAEMPVLNNLVKEYSNRDDIVFISLAFDSKEQLKTFLTKTKFDYAVVPVPQKYLEEKLNVRGYPTHFVINKKGLIVKVANRADDMIAVLREELLNEGTEAK